MFVTESSISQPWTNNYHTGASNLGDATPGLATQYSPHPNYPQEHAQLQKSSDERQQQHLINQGNVPFDERHYNSYQSTARTKPIRVRNDKVIKKSNSMKAIVKINGRTQTPKKEGGVTIAYVEMQTTPIDEMHATGESGEIKFPRCAGGKKENEGKKARGTSISTNIWNTYYDTINNGLRPRSSLGFGKAEIRFADQPTPAELSQRLQVGKDLSPGPGQYHDDLKMIGKEKTESFSKKGYGNGFLSRLRRFKDGKDFGYFVNIPGPGSYNTQQLDQAPNFSQSYSRNHLSANGSSVFASNVPRHLEYKVNDSPGPAAYKIKDFTDNSPPRGSLQQSSSNEKLLKLQSYFHYRKSVPSIPKFKSSEPSQSFINGLVSLESNKKASRTNIQSKTIEHTQKPDQVYSTLKILTQKVLYEEKEKKLDTVPGPGAYHQVGETIAAKSIAKFTEGITQYHIQRKREDQRRFREEYLQKRKQAMPEIDLKMHEKKNPIKEEPGPGSYDIERGASFGNAAKEVKSVFKSKSARELPIQIQKDSPGPAYYFKQSKIQEKLQSLQGKVVKRL